MLHPQSEPPTSHSAPPQAPPVPSDFEMKLTTWPKVGQNDATGLEEFSDFLQQVKIASKHIESLKVLSYPSQIQVLVEKLHGWFKAK